MATFFQKTIIKQKAVIALLLLLVMFSGCTAKVDGPAQQQASTEEAVQSQNPEIQEFFNNYVNTHQRPIAVMVDNDDKNARPHAGLDEAYLIYEMVVEGGSTRFMALYRHDDVAKIGPVRSSRHYFLDSVLEHDAIYTHYGWSPNASRDIASFGINNINGVLGVDGTIFWREEKYKGDWHSAYTSVAKIKEMARKKSYADETAKKGGIQYATEYITLPTDNKASKISLPYSGKYKTGYQYNEQTGLYEKQIDGTRHVMQNGNVLAVKNVIVQLITDTSLGDGTDRRNINTTGSGKGYYFTGGSYEEITWSKSSRQGNTVYKKADGTELRINPGKTIVNFIDPTIGVTFE